MKKYVVIGLVLAALVFAACKDGEKGGTIVIVNEYHPVGGVATAVEINITSILPPVTKFETIPAGGKSEFSFDKDGTYTILSAPGTPSPSTAPLSGGNTVTVTIR